MYEFKYNFPLITKKLSKRKQIEKIFEELVEFLMSTTEEEKYIELMDVEHCIETFIRYNMDKDKINKYMNKVIEKNKRRGYYDITENKISKKSKIFKWLKDIREVWKSIINNLSRIDKDKYKQ